MVVGRQSVRYLNSKADTLPEPEPLKAQRKTVLWGSQITNGIELEFLYLWKLPHHAGLSKLLQKAACLPI